MSSRAPRAPGASVVPLPCRAALVGAALVGLASLAPLVSVAAAPAAAPRPLTVEDVARLRAVGDVALSPDGTRVAYAVVVPRTPGVDDDGPAWGELHVAAVKDGAAGAAGAQGASGASRPFVTGKVSVSSIKWSPDGTLVSYVAKRDGDERATIWIIPADGGESRRAVTHAGEIVHYDWRPDGRGLALVAAEPKDEAREALKKKGFDQVVFEEDWTPRRVYLAELAAPGGSSPTTAPAAPIALPLALPGQPFHVRWAPDGARLLVDLAPTPLVDDEYMARRLHVIDTSGKVLATIDNKGKLGDFGWSADGRQVLLVGASRLEDTKEGRLMAAPAAGGAPRDLLPGLEGHVEEFVATPGGAVYLAAVGTGSRIGRVSTADAQERALLLGSGAAERPVVAQISVSRDGRTIAFVGETPSAPRELYTAALPAPDAAGAPAPAPRRVTDSNPWLRQVQLGRQEVVTWTARDGLKIEGLLIHPAGAAAARAPLIVVAHGGPEAHFRNGWLTRYSDPGQVAAGRGYLVFYPNYRGSTGRGIAFALSSQKDAGGREFDDVLDGIDALVQRGLVDPARVGITGGSYGGYFTAWGATRHSERFAAGVMFVGITNLVSKAGTTDIPREEMLVHRGTPHLSDNADELKRSPLSYVGNARTPLLILGGTADTRVDPGQSLELYRALKMKGGVPVRLVRYPGEGHGNRDSAARYDYMLRLLQWFDHFLLQQKDDLPPRDVPYAKDWN